MWTGLTLGHSLFTYSHKSFSILYKIANCRDALLLCAKTFCLVSICSDHLFKIIVVGNWGVGKTSLQTKYLVSIIV